MDRQNAPGHPMVSEFYGFGRIDAAAAVRQAQAMAKSSKSNDNVPQWSDASGYDDAAGHSMIPLAVARDDLYQLA